VSSRAAFFDGIPNRLYREKEARFKKGDSLIDLVSGNPNTQGICFPQTILKRALTAAFPLARIYHPDPQGQGVARSAIEAYYAGGGISLPADQIVLTPGTSVSYGYLFALLADPGDELLCPTPTYPLFEAIAAIHNVKIVYYRLTPSARWAIDFDSLRKKINPKTRAIILISPHNPTGSVATPEEMAQLSAIADRQGLPIISDEVFSPFLFTRNRFPRPSSSGLVFTLNGISKMLALPGCKIGWIGVSGDPERVRKSVRRLRGISDTNLPVNELMQFALPCLLDEGKSFMEQYRLELLRRLEVAVSALSNGAVSFIPPEGGFYITFQMTDTKCHDEPVAVRLLRNEGILVHPGYFYDLPPRSLVCSFVVRPVLLKKALERIIGTLHQLTKERDHA
jgi:aspartate/methionine/tyrosine aminotransferase